jgi:hypothetical protein
MLTSVSKQFNNIPVSFSLLHEKNYNNKVVLLYKKNSNDKRRAYSETHIKNKLLDTKIQMIKV